MKRNKAKKNMQFKIDNKLIGDNTSNQCFIIAEIGQNHQGDINIAKEMIKCAKECGADCVKFQKSSLNDKFTKEALDRRYTSINSFGQTYGDHKSYLEFSIEQFHDLQQYATDLGVIFSASAMDSTSFEQLHSLRLPFIKIGSGDANNFPLLQYAAQKEAPLVISTGMQTKLTVEKIVEIMNENNKKNYCLLHCISSYPTDAKSVQLRMLDNYRKWFPGISLGYSGHELGTAISVAAVCLGAKIIERHFTLNKHQKGTDHQLSLEPEEMRKMIQNIRTIENELIENLQENYQIINKMKTLNYSQNELTHVEEALQFVEDNRIVQPCEMDCYNKLRKSLVYQRPLLKGHCIKSNDICAKVSEPHGMSAEQYFTILDKTLIKNVDYDERIKSEHFALF